MVIPMIELIALLRRKSLHLFLSSIKLS